MNQYTNPEQDQRSVFELDREEEDRIRRAEESLREYARQQFAEVRPMFSSPVKKKEPRWKVI